MSEYRINLNGSGPFTNPQSSQRQMREVNNVKMMRYKSLIHVEVEQQSRSSLDKASIIAMTKEFLQKQRSFDNLPMSLHGSTDLNEVYAHINRINVSASGVLGGNHGSIFRNSPTKFYVYKLNHNANQLDGEIEVSENVTAASCHVLPNAEFDGLWDSLIYDSNIKEEALRYVETAMIASECKVDTMLIGLNRLILLSGPPGTGKTSLCKALAQKTAIRMSSNFTEIQLVEINSHSLFSKWFSESGKLVQKMFDQLHDLLEDPKLYLFVLIDEVESLTMSRENSKNEPSDGLRVVNALLTQIDQLKKFRNVLVLATSNLRNKIDDAFLDRADVSYEVGLPSSETAYDILCSCVVEFRTKDLIRKDGATAMFNYKFLCDYSSKSDDTVCDYSAYGDDTMRYSKILLCIVKEMKPCSARLLRKVAFQALMKVSELPCNMTDFLDALGECCLKLHST